MTEKSRGFAGVLEQALSLLQEKEAALRKQITEKMTVLRNLLENRPRWTDYADTANEMQFIHKNQEWIELYEREFEGLREILDSGKETEK